MADVRQPLRHLVRVGSVLLGDLVADAPQDDAGMVAVATDHVRPGPARSTRRRTGRTRTSSSTVFHSSNASSITRNPMRSHRSSSSGAGGLWLVRMALQPMRLHDLQLALDGAACARPRPGSPGRGGGRRPGCDVLAVQEETLVQGELERADAEGASRRRPRSGRSRAPWTRRGRDAGFSSDQSFGVGTSRSCSKTLTLSGLRLVCVERLTAVAAPGVVHNDGLKRHRLIRQRTGSGPSFRREPSPCSRTPAAWSHTCPSARRGPASVIVRRTCR